ncbi:HNH endonuclease [Vreelandella sp.]|uniref:HNH endonuclease n=1 Tax=Vreelandella sp. TaxID=3137778 RepID=UPI003BA998B4
MGCPEGQVVDHVNGNTLDNRRNNLRICTEQQNRWNRKVHRNNSTGIRGVYCEHLKGGGVRWRAQIRKCGKTYRLGSFRSSEEARQARVEAEKRLFGQFAPCLSRSS